TKTLLLALGVFALGWQPGPGSAADQPTTEELIARLGSPKHAERQRAARLLSERGPGVLPELRKSLKHRDPEIRRAAEKLIPTLEAAVALQPKLLTLEMNAPLADVFKEIEKQSGYQLTAEGKEEGRVSVAVRRMPFWEAVAHIEQQTGLRVNVMALDSGISFTGSGRRSPFVQSSGPFRLDAT